GTEPVPVDAAPAAPPADGIGPAALLGRIGMPVDAIAVADGPGTATGVDRQWQLRLSDIAGQYGLTPLQEAEFQRLAERQQQRISETIPRLIEETRQHFDTPGEAEAKRRYQESLQALKAELDRETVELLQAFVRE